MIQLGKLTDQVSPMTQRSRTCVCSSVYKNGGLANGYLVNVCPSRDLALHVQVYGRA